ncbi:small multi-drug export protein [Candidatus Uhrbacteria bacterium]|nr:small multi-drug export protein [Candidatus Uhrbacteria bacterium]
MFDQYLIWFRDLPPALATLIIAMIPIAELRVSIPVALEVYHLSIPSAIFWSVLGDMIPATLIIMFIDRLAAWGCRHSKRTEHFYQRMAKRTAKKFEKGYLKYGAAVALALFVGVPLPMTGSWSGALAAFLFGIPKRVALPAILVGVCLAAGVVALAYLGLVKLFF